MKRTSRPPKKVWQKSSVANLVRYVPSGIYFARVRVGGKLIRRSLKTNVLSVSRLRLTGLLREERQRLEARASTSRGKMVVGDVLQLYLERLEANRALKPSAKLYRRKCVEALVRSWPGLIELDVQRISERDCMDWASRFGAKYAPSVFNNTV